jgi:uncharacterized membrane protein YqiK
MEKLGLEVVNFNIQNFTDNASTIENLGIDNVEKIRKDAQIAKANAQRDIAIAEAKAKELLSKDKESSASKSAILCAIIAVICAVAGVFYPITFIGTALMAAVAVYFFSNTKKHKADSESAMKDILETERKKSEILRRVV